jgi:hypothetical protein
VASSNLTSSGQRFGVQGGIWYEVLLLGCGIKPIEISVISVHKFPSYAGHIMPSLSGSNGWVGFGQCWFS